MKFLKSNDPNRKLGKPTFRRKLFTIWGLLIQSWVRSTSRKQWHLFFPPKNNFSCWCRIPALVLVKHFSSINCLIEFEIFRSKLFTESSQKHDKRVDLLGDLVEPKWKRWFLSADESTWALCEYYLQFCNVPDWWFQMVQRWV